MHKSFVAISTEIQNDKLVLINTSIGRHIYNQDGISFDAAIDFLFGLRLRRKPRTVFVCYAFQRDNEFLFSQLPKEIKDKLFQSYPVRKQQDELESELELIDYKYFSHKDKDSEDFEQLTFDRFVNRLSLKDLTEIQYNGYNIRLINGKLLTISKKGTRFILYDVYGFFRKPLYDVVKIWLQKDIKLLDTTSSASNAKFSVILNRSNAETKYIEKLTTVLNESLVENGINLSRYHGVTTISSWLLSKTKAKKEFHSYKHRTQLGGNLYKAVMQAYYGGRTEQFKIGTFKDGVNVFDINSAYAYAVLSLPVLTSLPIPVSEYHPEYPFAIWFCHYDFTKLDSYFGFLPNRDAGNSVKYKQRGKGFFWSPEINYIVQNYPDCIEVLHGYYIPYHKAHFTKGVRELYKLRIKLQELSHPLEKIIKLALSAIYGKFCQQQKGYYYNMMYAGYITSLTRMKLLEATKNNEEKTICFLTDAIHTTSGTVNGTCSKIIGDYKHNTYSKGVYLDNGVYRLYDGIGDIAKEKTKGFRQFNFDRALTELQDKRTYTALAEFFVGHNLYSFMPVKFQQYLKLQKESKQTNPFELSTRLFDSLGIDLTNEYCESKLLNTYSGRESGLYHSRYYKEADLAKDSLMANRV